MVTFNCPLDGTEDQMERMGIVWIRLAPVGKPVKGPSRWHLSTLNPGGALSWAGLWGCVNVESRLSSSEPARTGFSLLWTVGVSSCFKFLLQ